MSTCSTCGTSYPDTVRLCPKDGTVIEEDITVEQKHLGRILDGKYRLDAVISQGGMGVVYKATHVMLGKAVAVKLIKPELVVSPEVARRFQREGRAAANLSHPGIVAVYDLGQTDDGTLYIAMELVEGPSLKDVIRSGGPMEPARTVRLLQQVSRALSVAHRHGVVHRDLKPQNVMLTTDSHGEEVAKLLDFGIAKTFDDTATQLTMAGYALGTPQYMSPEQALGKEVDARSDLYSLGVILYEMLVGQVPFNDPSSAAILVKHMNEAPVAPSLRRPDLPIPPALEAMALRAMEKSPEARFQSAEEFSGALATALTGAAAAATAGATGGAADAPTIPMAVPGGVPAAGAATIVAPPAGAVASPGRTSAAPAPGPAIAVPPPLPAGAVSARTGTRPTVPLPPAAAPAEAAPQTPARPPAPAPVAPAPASTVAPAPLAPAAASTAVPAPKATRPAIVVAALVVIAVAAALVAYQFSYLPGFGPKPVGESGAAGAASARVPEATPAMAAGPPARPAADDATQAVPSTTQAANPPETTAPGGPRGPAVSGERPAGVGAERTPRSPGAGSTASSSPTAPRPEPAASKAALPAIPSVFVACGGAPEICPTVRAAFSQALQGQNLPGARSADRADIALEVNVTLTDEQSSVQFGQTFVVRTYTMEVAGEAIRSGDVLSMPAPRSFSFDARVGRDRATENSRALAEAALDSVKAYWGKRLD